MLATYGVAPSIGITLGVLWFFVTVVAGLVGGIVYLYGGRASRDAASLKPTDSDPWASWSAIGPLRAKIADMCFSIVVPVYNERENLSQLCGDITSVMDQLRRPYEMLLVDDGSTDGSGRLLDELAEQDRRVKLIRFRRNFGQTAAMSAGLHMAGGDVIITLDADLQNDPADIPMMVDKLCEGFDLVHGWRRDRRDALLTRRVPSQIANWIISKVTGFPVHDLGCTLKVIRREFAGELPLYGDMHRFIPILAHWRGARCAEVVTRHHPRRFGESKYGLSRTIRVLLDLLAVRSITRRPPYAIRELVNFDQPLEIGEARRAA
jgi:glycosyltransferase involved in cell wall biosynthesis